MSEKNAPDDVSRETLGRETSGPIRMDPPDLGLFCAAVILIMERAIVMLEEPKPGDPEWDSDRDHLFRDYQGLTNALLKTQHVVPIGSWICHCDSHNSMKVDYCWNCKRPRGWKGEETT